MWRFPEEGPKNIIGVIESPYLTAVETAWSIFNATSNNLFSPWQKKKKKRSCRSPKEKELA